MTRRLFLIAAALATATLATAADKPDFSGDWTVNIEKSDFGPMPPPTKIARKITHKDPSMSYTETREGGMGDSSADIQFTTDGKECPNKIKLPTGDDLEMKITANWEGNVLVSTVKFEFQGMEITSVGRWTMSEDGKTFTESAKISTSQGDFETTQVFEKAAAK